MLVNEIGNLAGTPAGAAYTYGSGKPHAPTSAAGGTSFVWNPDGTLGSSTTPAGTTGYTWDVFDRLTQINATPTGGGSSTVAKMAYWPGGQRALLVEGGATHLYVGTFEERHRTSGGTVTDKRYYSHGSVTVAVREQTGSTNTLTVLLGDVRGSVAATVTATSTSTVATNANTYGPYGAPGTTGVTATTRGYIGQHTDTSGLDYLNNRYYQPTWGIFLTVDPLVDTTGQPYLYAGGNPTSASDPSGLCWRNNGRQGADDGNPCVAGQPGGVQPTQSCDSNACAQVLDFNIPRKAGWGTVQINLFISACAVGGVVNKSRGDCRGFDENATCSMSRACVIFDFESGRAHLEINYSCRFDGSCHDAWRIGGNVNSVTIGTDGSWFTLRAKHADSSLQETLNFLDVDLDVNIGTSLDPIINSAVSESYESGYVRHSGIAISGEDYPSTEVYRNHHIEIQSRENSAVLGIPYALADWWPSSNDSFIDMVPPTEVIYGQPTVQ